MADVPKIDFDKISGNLKEHFEGEHKDEIMERLNDKYQSHRKSVKGKRKLDMQQAEALGHQLYDELRDYVMDYYKLDKNKSKDLKGVKGKHGESMLDSIVENEFKLDRTQLINSLKKASESGQKFSAKYVRDLLEDNVDKYSNHKMQKILRDLHYEHKGDIQKQITSFIEQHKLDKTKYKGVLKPSAEFDDVIQAYAQLAGNYYLPDAKKPTAYKMAA